MKKVSININEKQQNFQYKYSAILLSLSELFKQGLISEEEKSNIKRKIYEKDDRILKIFNKFQNLKDLHKDLLKSLKKDLSNINNLSITTIDDLGNFTSDAKAAKYYINVISEKKKSKFSRKFSKNSNHSDKQSLNNLSTSADNENIFEKKFNIIKNFQEQPESEFVIPNLLKRHSSISVINFKFYDNDL